MSRRLVLVSSSFDCVMYFHRMLLHNLASRFCGFSTHIQSLFNLEFGI